MAWLTSIPAIAIGSFVLGHFFGEAVWQFVKHGTVNAIQAAKSKFVS